MLSWSSCLTPLTLLPHHSILFFFGIVVKKRYGKRGFAIILKVTISHESHNFRYSMCDSKFNSRFSLLLSHCFLCVLCFICVHVIYIFLCFCSVFVCVCFIWGLGSVLLVLSLMLKGVKELADAVKVTMGPKG